MKKCSFCQNQAYSVIQHKDESVKHNVCFFCVHDLHACSWNYYEFLKLKGAA